MAMAAEKIIIDTDPGVDDVLAIALALNHPSKLQVLLLTLSHGNVGVERCLKNLVVLFGVLEREKEFRKLNGLRDVAFEKPIVAIGADKPVLKQHAHGDPPEDCDTWEGFHGVDGLNGVYSRISNLIPLDYRAPFNPTTKEPESPKTFNNFVPSTTPAHMEILNQLRLHERKSITIVAIGPCTNLALAAAEDPVTFARVKKIIIMGGAVRVPGNTTPRAEFNFYADPDAAADILNLTQRERAETPLGQMNVALVPLDISSHHTLSQDTWQEFSKDLVMKGSPLAIFVDSVLGETFYKMKCLFGIGIFGCHDALTVHALLEPDIVEYEHDLDIRIETDGIWTRGESVLDRRSPVKWTPGMKVVIRDNGGWLSGSSVNSVSILKSSGFMGSAFGMKLLEGIFL